MTGIQYRNVSNLTAFGVQWEAGENGNAYQLVNKRGTTTLTFGVKNESEGRAEWSNTTVIDPGRFGLTSPPKSFTEFMHTVHTYVEK